MPIIKRHAALYDYPEARNRSAHNDLVLDGIDGNTLKLIYMLLRENVIKLDKDDYQTLVTLYLKNTQVRKAPFIQLFKHRNTAGDLHLFLTTLKKIKVINRPNIHLFGSELVGHGYNDYLTLMLLAHMDNENLPFDITLSNNDSEFVGLFEEYYHMEAITDLWSESAPSLYHLLELIRDKKLSVAEVRELVQSNFYPHLKLINYIVDKDTKEIFIFIHAPNGFETIKAIAELYSLPFSAKSIDSITNTIDAINDFAHEDFLRHTFTEQLNIDALNGLDENQAISLEDPLLRLLWNCTIDKSCDHKSRGDYQVHFVHALGSASLYLQEDIPYVDDHTPATQTEGHYQVCESAFSYSVLQSDAPFYESHYARFIKLANQLNQMMPPPKKQSRAHTLALQLLKASHVDVLAHLDDITICKLNIDILDYTIKLFNHPTEEVKGNYSCLLSKVNREKLSPASNALHLKMVGILIQFQQHKHKDRTWEAKRDQDQGDKAHRMLNFSSPLRQISTHPTKALSKRGDIHVHFDSAPEKRFSRL